MGRRRAHSPGLRGLRGAPGAVVAAVTLLAGAATAAPAYADTDVDCSTTDLIAAITAANAGSGDTLNLASYCVYTLTDADGQLPTITQPLVIHGNHATIRRDPNATTNFRILNVGNTSLTMDTLTVMNGNGGTSGGGVNLNTGAGSLTTTDVNFQGSSALFGGAIFAGSGTTLSLTRGTVNDNRSTSTGGGIMAVGSNNAVMLNSVTVSGNRTSDAGGGVFLNTGLTSTITNSVISDNTARGSGGGLSFVGDGPLTVTGTTIADNRVTNSFSGGGGVDIEQNLSGSITFVDSTISGNVVKGFTGTDGSANGGGGIHLEFGPLTLDKTTVSDNQVIGAGGIGGGIAVRATGNAAPTTLTLQNGTTLTRNLASGRYSQGGGLHAANGDGDVSVSLTDSHIDANKVTGTGSAAGGIFNVDGTFSFATSSVNDNIAPSAPAPGGVSTGVAITTVDGSTTFTGNTPTNCLLSPQPVTNCSN
ncbi:hypothetical protein ABZ845_14200 [Streptomyces sp. NPDC047022]|uniref:hypothetical protein n=1 Tax=Streptomyces sp. NPDC047022 TaxID=3155737 RepID=UPI0033E979FB